MYKVFVQGDKLVYISKYGVASYPVNLKHSNVSQEKLWKEYWE